MIDELRRELRAAETELAAVRREQAQLAEREAALATFVADARKAVASYEALEAESTDRRGLQLPVPSVEQLIEFLRTQTDGVVAVEELVARFNLGPQAVAELARRRTAQGRLAYDTARGLVKLLS